MNTKRTAPIEIQPEEFRSIGYHLVDKIAELLDSLPTRPVTTAEAPPAIREVLDSSRLLPDEGVDPAQLDRAAGVVRSLLTIPGFWGHLAPAARWDHLDFLASAISRTLAHISSPMAVRSKPDHN
jgi:hypothetical protein